MITFNEQQQKTLTLICRTFCNVLPAKNNVGKSGNPERSYQAAEHIFRRLSAESTAEQNLFSKLLHWIEFPGFCFVLTGTIRPFSKLDQGSREKVLRRWRSSRFPQLRRFFQSIKRITLFLWYANDESQGSPSIAEELGYAGRNPLQTQENEPQLQFLSADQGDVISSQVLVIGSGAGGSVAAANLAANGHEVLIVEKGSQTAASQLGVSELDGNRRLFDKMGALTTRDLAVVILSGSTVGGGTTVNWMTCLDLPSEVKQQWAERHGFDQVLSRDFDEANERVKRRLNVNTNESILNGQNQVLKNGCDELGYRTHLIPRNADGCGDCGYCGYGCRQGAKQDTRQTFLTDAALSGARTITDCEIRRLVVHGDRIQYAEAEIRTKNGKRPIKINCEQVVLAGGAVHSAAILLRSGFQNIHIGKHLNLHPTTAIASFFDHDIVPWQGPPQTIVCDQFANLDNAGYGVRLEVAPVHPGFAAMALAWDSAHQHHSWMKKVKQMANIIVLTRDRGSGRVYLKKDGATGIEYQLDSVDAAHMMTGVKNAVTIHHAAGAKMIVGPHQTPISYQFGKTQFEDFTQRVVQAGTAANSLSLFSAHQMATCRMGRDPNEAVFDTNGCSFECSNLYVADASGLPSSCGVNPMLTIMSVADMLSRQWTF